MAEVKLAMHKEMLGKDEVQFDERRKYQVSMTITFQEITNLRSSLASVSTEREQLAGEVDALKLEVGSTSQSWERRIHQGRLGAWVRSEICKFSH